MQGTERALPGPLRSPRAHLDPAVLSPGLHPRTSSHALFKTNGHSLRPQTSPQGRGPASGPSGWPHEGQEVMAWRLPAPRHPQLQARSPFLRKAGLGQLSERGTALNMLHPGQALGCKSRAHLSLCERSPLQNGARGSCWGVGALGWGFRDAKSAPAPPSSTGTALCQPAAPDSRLAPPWERALGTLWFPASQQELGL